MWGRTHASLKVGYLKGRSDRSNAQRLITEVGREGELQVNALVTCIERCHPVGGVLARRGGIPPESPGIGAVEEERAHSSYPWVNIRFVEICWIILANSVGMRLGPLYESRLIVCPGVITTCGYHRWADLRSRSDSVTLRHSYSHTQWIKKEAMGVSKRHRCDANRDRTGELEEHLKYRPRSLQGG